MWPQLSPREPLDYSVSRQDRDLQPRNPMSALVRTLFERRIPHTLAIYAGASWALVEFVAFAVDEFQLSPHLTRVVLAGLLLLLPSVFMLAWFHGKPGKDREELARTEKIGIPANLVLCALVLWVLFADRDLGAATTTVTVQTEDGEMVDREVVKPEFRKRTALFAMEPGEGLGEDELWTTYAVPLAIEYDLMAEDYFVPIPFDGLTWRLRRDGYPELHGAPLSLKLEAAREQFAGFLAVGVVGKVDDSYRVTLTVHETKGGAVLGETGHEGSDLLALVDEMSVSVRTALGIPAGDGIEDLPVRQRLTEDDAALKEFVSGLLRRSQGWYPEEVVDHLTAATTLDPTFTAAHRELSQLLRADRPAEALKAIAAAMEYLYRLPERAAFQVRTDFYRLNGETDRAAAIIDMWLELHPDDPGALESKWANQALEGDLQGALATLEDLYSLSPGNGFILSDLAEMRERVGRFDEAEAAYREYVDRFPDDEHGVQQLAGFLRRHGEHVEARDILARAVLLQPLSAQLARALAGLDLETGRFDDARRAYERMRDQPGTAYARTDALVGLRRYHHFRGEIQSAIGASSAHTGEMETLVGPVAVAEGAFENILLLVDAGRIGEAATLLEGLKASDSQSMRLLLTPRASIRVALASGDVEAAREAHVHAIEKLDSTGLDHLRWVPMGDLGMIQERAGDYEAAAESYRTSVHLAEDAGFSRDPELTGFRLGAGRALRKAGRLDESEAELRQVLLRIPAHPHAHLELALLMEARGDTAGAIEHLQSALAAWENADESYEPAEEARRKLAELGG